MKQRSRLLYLSLVIVFVIPSLSEAANPPPGKWTGWIIMDPWGGMWLYNYSRVYPIDKALIPELKEYAGKPVVLNVKKVFQIDDSGPAKIMKAEYIKETRPDEMKTLSLSVDIMLSLPNEVSINLKIKN